MVLYGIKDYKDFSSSDEELQKIDSSKQLRQSNHQVHTRLDFMSVDGESGQIQRIDFDDSEIQNMSSKIESKDPRSFARNKITPD